MNTEEIVRQALEGPSDAEDIVATIALGLERGYSPSDLLDENSPVRDRIRRLSRALEKALAAAPVEPHPDTARLEYLISRSAHVGWTKDSELCRVAVYDEEGNYVPACGWEKFFHDPREAIDAAMSTIPSTGGLK